MITLRRIMRFVGAPVLMALAVVLPASAEALEKVLVVSESQSLQRSPTRVRRSNEGSPLARASAAYAQGRFDEAADLLTQYLALDPAHPRAHLLLALCHWKRGNMDEAWASFERAAALAPDDAQVHLGMGNLLHASGRHEAAADAFLRAVQLDPALAAAHFNRGTVLRESGNVREAILAFRAAARLDPSDFESTHNVVGTLADAIRTQQAPVFFANGYESRPVPAPVSIVTCSIDPVRLARFRAGLEPHLSGIDHELIVISDAQSLCEGYSRGVQASRHDTVVLMHDDVQFVSPQPFHALGEALASHDVVGLAGSRRLAGPTVLWAGHPHIHGWVSYPAAEGGYEVWPLSLESGVLSGMQALDGLMLAMRRETALAIGFDAATFDGFHFYDLDFCVRAHRAGLSMAVTTEVAAVHDSIGSYDDDWRRYAGRFAAKYPELQSPQGASHAYGAPLDRIEDIARFHRELAGLAQVT